MGLIKAILKGLFDDNNYEESKIDKYNLSKEEKEDVKKGNYQPDEFDYDDDDDHD